MSVSILTKHGNGLIEYQTHDGEKHQMRSVRSMDFESGTGIESEDPFGIHKIKMAPKHGEEVEFAKEAKLFSEHLGCDLEMEVRIQPNVG